jgi:cold shock CspA family protein
MAERRRGNSRLQGRPLDDDGAIDLSVHRPPMAGVIKKLITDKKFGFIKGSDGVDYFFHATSVEGGVGVFDRFIVGDAVTFEVDVKQSDKGPRAAKVSPSHGSSMNGSAF